MEALHDSFMKHLRAIVSIPSCYEDVAGRQRVMDYVRECLDSKLTDHEIVVDDGGNIVAFRSNSDEAVRVYLSAHVDTVDAEIDQWQAPYHPFEPYEDAIDYVARGVNDCKAGVAFQLALLDCAPVDVLDKIVFTFTFKEEGPGDKTALYIGRKIGDVYPVGRKSTYLFVLENTTKVTEPVCVSAFVEERNNYAVSTSVPLGELADWMRDNPDWVPTTIIPEQDGVLEAASDVQNFASKGGHVVSPQADQWFLRDLIYKHADYHVLSGGETGGFSTLPTEIVLCGSDVKDNVHYVTLNNRSHTSSQDIEKQLASLPHEYLKPLQFSMGFNARNMAGFDALKEQLKQVAADDMGLELDINPGNSDGSYIYNQIPSQYRDGFVPLVIGPGCRSQWDREPVRLTHGVNETLHKVSAFQAVDFIARLITTILD